LDLRKIRAKVDRKERLTEEETAAWNRCSAMLILRSGVSDEEGDLVVVKNVPERQKFTIVQIIGTKGHGARRWQLRAGWPFVRVIPPGLAQPRDTNELRRRLGNRSEAPPWT
jgi:hypothetical protein